MVVAKTLAKQVVRLREQAVSRDFHNAEKITKKLQNFFSS
jgi:hypothetical protein